MTLALIELLHNGNYALAKNNDYTNIFSEGKDLSNQYGANQQVFNYHYDKLTKDELIWGEIQQ